MKVKSLVYHVLTLRLIDRLQKGFGQRQFTSFVVDQIYCNLQTSTSFLQPITSQRVG